MPEAQGNELAGLHTEGVDEVDINIASVLFYRIGKVVEQGQSSWVEILSEGSSQVAISDAPNSAHIFSPGVMSAPSSSYTAALFPYVPALAILSSSTKSELTGGGREEQAELIVGFPVHTQCTCQVAGP